MVDTNELLQKQEVEIKKKSEQSQLLVAEQEELEKQLEYLNSLIASQDSYLQNLERVENTVQENIRKIENAMNVEIDTTVPDGAFDKLVEKNRDRLDDSPMYEEISDEETPMEPNDLEDFFSDDGKPNPKAMRTPDDFLSEYSYSDPSESMTPVSGSEDEEEEEEKKPAKKGKKAPKGRARRRRRRSEA